MNDIQKMIWSKIQCIEGSQIGFTTTCSCHNKRFVFRVTINGESAGEGSGRSKKEAEQMAAREALKKLQT